MSRETIIRQVMVKRPEVVTAYQCDGCNRKIRRDGDDDFAHELLITLDQERCVNFYRRRDLCPACLDAIWVKLNELIGVEPGSAWDEADREYDVD